MKAVCFALFTAVASFAATVTTGNTCTVAFVGSVTSAEPCSLYGTFPTQAAADTAAAFSIQGNTLSTAVSSSVKTTATGLGYANAASSASLAIDLYTDGPVRTGLVRVSANTLWAFSPEGFSGSMTYSLASANGGCLATASRCAASTVTLPFTLGTSFLFTESQEFDALNNAATNGLSNGMGTTKLAFSFFEADGVTAVSVFDPPAATPEPGSWALAALGVIGAALAKRR